MKELLSHIRSKAMLASASVLLVLIGCNSNNVGKTALAAATGGGYSAEVVTTNSWNGGFSGAVRIGNTSGASITSFEVGFKFKGSEGVSGNAWNGSVSSADSSGVRLATNPAYLQYSPISTGKTWDVGFNGTGNFVGADITSLKINGKTISLGSSGGSTGGGTTTDTTAPTVSLTSSSTSVTAANSITLTATASDNVAVSKVEFYDGTTLLASDATSPYTQVVQFTATNNGTKSYTAKAFDAAGNTATSSAVLVVVNIGTTNTADTTAPTPHIEASASSVTSAGTLTLTSRPTDNVGIAKVQFFDGSTMIFEDLTGPYAYPVDLTSANNGTHSYTAKAFDAAGNTATSSAVSVVVNITSSGSSGGNTGGGTVSTITTATTIGNLCPDYKAMYMERTMMDYFPGNSTGSSHGGAGDAGSRLSDSEKAAKYQVNLSSIKTKADSGNFASINFADMGTEAIKHAQAYRAAGYPDKAICQLLPRLMLLGVNDVEPPAFHVNASNAWAEASAVKAANIVGTVSQGVSSDARTYVPAEADERDRCHNQPRIENNVGWTATTSPTDRLNTNNPVLDAIRNQKHPISGAALGSSFSANAKMEAQAKVLQESADFWYLTLILKNTSAVPQNLSCAVIWFVGPSSWAAGLNNGHYDNVQRPAPGYGHPQRDIIEVVYDTAKEYSVYVVRLSFHDEPNNMRTAYPNQYWALEFGLSAAGKTTATSARRYTTSAQKQDVVNTMLNTLHVELESNLDRNISLLDKLDLRNRVTN